MWCSICQQDVPALGSPGQAGDLRCGKCGGSLPAAGADNSVGTASAPDFVPLSAVAAAPTGGKPVVTMPLHGGPLPDDDWALEAELRGVQRLVGALKSQSTRVVEPAAVHGSQQVPAAWHTRPGPFADRATTSSFSSRTTEHQEAAGHDSLPQPRGHAVAWTILSLGLAVFACGAVLLGWSLVGQREDLWPVGMPLALIGQAGLILGLILQLDGLWHTSRKTAQALNELDGELKNVRQATTLLSTTHTSGAQSFYFHLAEGASPQLLLADLKGQMDLLAQQMARGKG